MAKSISNLLVTATFVAITRNLVVSAVDNPLSSYEVLFGWKEVDYNFSSSEQRQRFLESKEFVKENNVITGIKVYGSRVYLTVPRWRSGIPSTLNYVDLEEDATKTSESGSVTLKPYPSWEMQEIGNCESLQYIQSMEVDRWGRMWAVDVGRTEIFRRRNESGVGNCRAKIVLIDLNEDKVLHKFEFPEDVVSPQSNFLNDLAVGCEGEGEEEKMNCFAYITDALDARLVVYDLAKDRGWFVHHKSMQIDPEATVIPILGQNYTFNTNIDGIALSPKDRSHDRVYYAPLSSFGLYSVQTSVLKEAVNGMQLRDSDVTTHDKRSSQCDGMAMDSQGNLLYALLSNNSVVYVNTSGENRFHKEILLVQNDIDLQWADTFAFDDKGYLYMTTNRIHRFQTNTLDWSEVNFRVARVYVGSRSYMYGAAEKVSTPPPQGGDSSSSNSNSGNPTTNLDPSAPTNPVGINSVDRKDSLVYEHDHHEHEDNHLGNAIHGDGDAGGNPADSQQTTSSAPPLNEHIPVVLFLSGLMFNPAINR